MKSKSKLLAILLIAAFPVASSYAGWMQSEGDIAVSTGLGFKDNGNLFDNQGIAQRNNCSNGFNIPVYAEYGMSYYNTIYTSTSFDSFNCGGVKQEGFNDIEAGIRGRMDYFIDHNWEVAAILPQHLTVNGAIRLPKQFGFKVSVHSSSRVDPYDSFLTEAELAKSNFGYGAGLKYWVGDAPVDLYGYLSYGRILKTSDWSTEVGGWTFTARLDGRTSFGKTYVTPGFVGVGVDQHDKYKLLTGTIGLNHPLSMNESVNFFLERGLMGQNANFLSGAFVTYSKVWRK